MYGATQRVRSRNSGTSAWNKANYSESITDWVVPKFHEKQNQGILLCHPLSKSRYDTAQWPGSVSLTKKMRRSTPPYDWIYPNPYVTYKQNPSFWTTAQTHPGWVNTAQSLITTRMNSRGVAFPLQGDIDLAITEVSSRIGSGCAQIWVTFLEFRKTIGMLCKALRLLRTPIKDALRALGKTVLSLRNQKDRIAVWTKACELWMEARYGWRPFVFDCMSLWDANVRSGSANHRLGKVKVVGNSESTEPGINWFSFTSIAPLAAHVAVDIRLQRFVKTGQTADFNAMITGPARVFGAYDIVGTAWEMIPLSWVVDKFINLGNVGQALQAALLVDERIGWTTKIELASVSNCRSVITQPGPITASGWTHYYVTDSLRNTMSDAYLDLSLKKERVVIENFTPVLGLEGKLDFAEYLDLLALFRVLRKGV